MSSHDTSVDASTTATQPIAIPGTLAAPSAADHLLSSSASSVSSAGSSPNGKRKTKCSFGCGAPVVKSVGTCRYCTQQYCAKHRLPEAHACANLSNCMTEAKDVLAKRLISEKTVASKVATA